MVVATIKPLREAAKAAGLLFFSTGTPCAQGHLSERYTSTGHCRECAMVKYARVSVTPEYKEQKRLYRKANPTIMRANSLKGRRRHRGAPEPTRPIAENCECCGRHKSDSKKAMHLDHDHVTGVFRGWLCNRCNAGIGMLGDNVAGLQRAIAYLERVQS